MDNNNAKILELLLEQMMENKRNLVGLGKQINDRFELLTPILRFLVSRHESDPQFAGLMDVLDGLVKLEKSTNSNLNKMDFGNSQMEAVIVRLKAALDREPGTDSPPQNDGETDEPRQE